MRIRGHTGRTGSALIAAVLGLLAVSPVIAYADQSGPDTDTSTNGLQTGPVTLSAVAGATVTYNVPVAVRKLGGWHLAAGQDITFTKDSSTTLPSGATVGSSTVHIPSTWATDGNGTTEAVGTSASISFTAPAASTTYSVAWHPGAHTCDGPAQGGQTDCVTETPLTIDLTVTSPPADTTAPTVSFEALTPDGLNGWFVSSPVAVTVDATDDTAVSSITCNLDGSTTALTPTSTSGLGTASASAVYSVSGDGDHWLVCTAKDPSNNTSDAVSQEVKIDTTEPVITYVGQSPAANGNGWNRASVTLTWSCSDATSGVDTTDSVTSQTVTTEGANQSASGSCVDNAGNNSTDTQHVSIDETNPVITYVGQSPGANANGWNNTDVTLTWSCSDALSGVDTTNSVTSVKLTTEGADQAATGICKDQAGNSVSDTRYVSIDKTKPLITYAGQTPAANTHGWNNTSVTLTWSCSDALSGVDTAASVESQTASSEGAGQAEIGSCVDKAGNIATDTESVSIDETKPAITIGAPAAGASYLLGQTAYADYTCSDGLSGLDYCGSATGLGGSSPEEVTTDLLNTSTVGSHSFSVTAADLAGNTQTASNSYGVGYAFIGFLPPVNNQPTVNTGKAGKTYPIKWQLEDANGRLLADTADGGPVNLSNTKVTFKATSCAAFTTDGTDALETTATGGTSLRYDTTAQQYVYNWATPSTRGVCYTMFLTLDSGQVEYAYFNLS